LKKKLKNLKKMDNFGKNEKLWKKIKKFEENG